MGLCNQNCRLGNFSEMNPLTIHGSNCFMDDFFCFLKGRYQCSFPEDVDRSEGQHKDYSDFWKMQVSVQKNFTFSYMFISSSLEINKKTPPGDGVKYMFELSLSPRGTICIAGSGYSPGQPFS